MNRNSPKWLYDENGYINMEHLIYGTKTWRVMVYGGRGSGKTYGAFKSILENGSVFLYLRRTDTQYKIIANKETSPIGVLNRDMGWSYYPYRENDKISAVYKTIENEDGKQVPEGKPVGYFSSVLSFFNVRGVDLSRVEVIVFDEFIAESHVQKKSGEFQALLNLYETVNRNRELKGGNPVKLVMLANTDSISNPYFSGWHLINQILRNKRNNVDYYIDPKGNYTLVATDNSPISAKKAETGFYQELKGSEFYNMAIDSGLDYKAGKNIKSCPIKEYTPLYTMGELTVYRHKSRKELYITEHRAGHAPYFEDTPKGHKGLDTFDRRLTVRMYCNFEDGAGWKLYFEKPENEIYFQTWYGLTK